MPKPLRSVTLIIVGDKSFRDQVVTNRNADEITNGIAKGKDDNGFAISEAMRVPLESEAAVLEAKGLPEVLRILLPRAKVVTQ